MPSDCKIGKLKLLFTKGSKAAHKNYRSIFLLPLVFKIIEKNTHDQTETFLETNNIIYRYQSRFRKFFSTDSCLCFLNNKTVTGFECGLYTGMILTDVQKAFDTKKPRYFNKENGFMGFSEGKTKCFKSYLNVLRFFYRQNRFLDVPLRRLLCNAMIQSFFDYVCNFYPK